MLVLTMMFDDTDNDVVKRVEEEERSFLQTKQTETVILSDFYFDL